MAKGHRALLPPEDEQRLQQLAETETGAIRQRALALLAWNDGQTANEAAQRSKLSVNQVQYLLRLYRRKGLDLVLVDSDEATEKAQPATSPSPEPEPAGMTLEALCAQYHVDMAHARYVGSLALQIFDATINIHRLPQNLRPILEAAAIVHNVAVEIDQPNHHLRGRDIVMSQAIRGFSDDERRILACTTSFHRKKVRPDAEPVFLELPEELRRDTLALSAILRIADGLDRSVTQTTHITDISIEAEEIVIEVDGLHAAENADQSQKKGDLWDKYFGPPVRVVVAEKSPRTTPVDSKFRLPTLSPEMNPTMSLERASRAFALHAINRVEALLRRVSAGELSLLPSLAREVARLSNALDLAEVKGYKKDLVWLTEAVEKAHIAAALAARAGAIADESGDTNLATKANAWDKDAHEAIKALDLERSAKWTRTLRDALNESPQGTERPHVGYYVGTLLWERLAELRQVMEHGESVLEAVNAARRLQDHLVAFRDLLGAEVGQVLDMLTPLESYLSAIFNTQHLLISMEQKPVRRGRKPAAQPAVDPALELLKQHMNGHMEILADSLPSVWASVNSAIFRRAFALAVAAP